MITKTVLAQKLNQPDLNIFATLRLLRPALTTVCIAITGLLLGGFFYFAGEYVENWADFSAIQKTAWTALGATAALSIPSFLSTMQFIGILALKKAGSRKCTQDAYALIGLLTETEDKDEQTILAQILCYIEMISRYSFIERDSQNFKAIRDLTLSRYQKIAGCAVNSPSIIQILKGNPDCLSSLKDLSISLFLLYQKETSLSTEDIPAFFE